MASVADIAPLSSEFDLPSKKGTRGPDKGPRAPSGFKNAIEEIAQVIFSKTKISVEGAAAAVTPNIPKLIADISNDIRTGSVEKFRISLEKLEKLVDNLGLDLRKYNKGLADFLRKRQENIVTSETKILDLREQGAKVEIDQVSGNINVLSKEEIKQRTDTLKQTLISLERTKKAKDREEKILQKRSSLSEQEIETKKKTVEQPYENIKTLEEQKQNLMKVLNIQSEEDLPSTGFFSRFKRRGGGDRRGGGEGIREYTPGFVMEIFDSFTDQIRGFMEPFMILKDVVFDLLKPLKLLGKLFMPLLKGFGRLIKTIGLQVLSGMALVAVNLLRILTDKKVLLALAASAVVIGGFLGLKKIVDKFKGKESPGDAGTSGQEADHEQLDYVQDPKVMSKRDPKDPKAPFYSKINKRIVQPDDPNYFVIKQKEGLPLAGITQDERVAMNQTLQNEAVKAPPGKLNSNIVSSNAMTSNNQQTTTMVGNAVTDVNNIWANKIA